MTVQDIVPAEYGVGGGPRALLLRALQEADAADRLLIEAEERVRLLNLLDAMNARIEIAKARTKLMGEYARIAHDVEQLDIK